MMGPRPVGLSMPSLNRYGGVGPHSAAATSTASQAAQEADSVKWYESGPFWTIVFLVVGYILVYRTIR